MNFKDKILYNDLGLIVYDGKIYNGGYKNEKKESKFNKKEIRNLKRLSVTFLSSALIVSPVTSSSLGFCSEGFSSAGFSSDGFYHL